MNVEFTDTLTPWLKTLEANAVKTAGEAVRRKLNEYQRDLKRLPVAVNVPFVDRVRGVELQRQPILISLDTEGATVTIRPFYGYAQDQQVRKALQMSGESYRLERDGLYIHKKIGGGTTDGPQHYVKFAAAFRLREWAIANDEYRRKAVVLKGAIELGYFWGPIRAKLILDVNRELAIKFSQQKQ